MLNNESFKNTHSFEKRSLEAINIKKKYPDRLPIIVEQSKNSNLPPLDKKKYLVPNDLTLGQFMYVIRKRITLEPEKAIFIFIKNSIPATNTLISQLYKEHKDEDGFLYCTINGENTFG